MIHLKQNKQYKIQLFDFGKRDYDESLSITPLASITEANKTPLQTLYVFFVELGNVTRIIPAQYAPCQNN